MYFNLKNMLKCIKNKHTKSRKYINKSNKKPWAQKHLGKARAGSFKSPLWRGGSVIFGPKHKKIKIKLNKKCKKLTLIYILLNKRSHIYVLMFYSLVHSFHPIETHLKQQMRINGIFSNKILFISSFKSKQLFISSFKVIQFNNITLDLLLNNDIIVFLI